jgi:glucoamylase
LPLLTGERAYYELAGGHNIKSYIRAIEGFASKGGMLPEQVWDEGPGLGKPAGSAMPLMWAHAEYIKLLKSVGDGKVFDHIAPVASRYLAGQGRKDLEVWQQTRRVHEVAPGQVLRILAPDRFLLHYSLDDWSTRQDRESSDSGLGI